jgi:hypothetical protein
MPTTDELAAALDALNQRQVQLLGEVQRLTAENAALRATAGSASPAAPGSPLEQMLLQLGQAVQLLSAQSASSSRQGQHSLIDVKGLGKPPQFKNSMAGFTEWLKKTSGFLVSAYGAGFRAVLEWIEDQEQPLQAADMDLQFGDQSQEPVPDLEEKGSQLHVVLLSLTEGESFDIVLGAAPSGFEALRRLIRRWDPLSGGRRRALLRQILVPDRAKLGELPLALERWEELVRRYEKRRAGGTVQPIDDDIKTAALESMVPPELEQHLAMNRARLPTYDHVRAEIQAYIEARRSQGALGSRERPQGASPMEVDVFMKNSKGSKGGGKSKDKGKSKGNSTGKIGKQASDVECWNCGKKGHRSAECWSKPKGHGKGAGSAASAAPHPHHGAPSPNGAHGHGKSKDKGKGAKSRGKGAYSLDQPEEELHPSFAQIVQDAGNLELGSLSAHATREVAPVDAPGSGAHREKYLDADGWLKFTYDTGAAVTAFPLDAKMGEETEPNESTYRTASGEIIPDKGGLKLQATTEARHPVTLNGRRADVHKILVSAGRVHAKGHVSYLNGAGGWVIPGGSALARKMEDLINEHARRTKGSLQLYQERGTYVGYVKVQKEYMNMKVKKGAEQAAPRAQALCPVALAGSSASATGASGASSSTARAPGGPRRPQWA